VLAVVWDQGLQQDTGREARHHLGHGAEKYALDHGGHAGLARRSVRLDPPVRKVNPDLARSLAI
jgi:hypothetical protein